MLEIFEHAFMVRALWAGILAAILTGVLGNFVVAGRQSVMSDMLAHVALAGVGLGVLMGGGPVNFALGTCVLGAVLLWGLLRQRRYPPEALAVVILTGGLALALVFSHWAKNKALSFDSYLFGSILTTSESELRWYAGLGAGILAVVFALWNRLLAVVIDPVFARSRFVHASWVELIFLILISLVVAISLQVIGGLMISAMLVIPVLAAQSWAGSFRASVAISVGVNLVAVLVGIVLSYYLDVPSGAAIVLTLIVCLAFCTQLAALRRG